MLQLQYVGTALHGCPSVPGQRTVCGELAAALQRLGASALDVEVLSRTDAGVHALGQVAVVSGHLRHEARALWRGLRRQLPPDLRCVGVALVDQVPSVVSKTYRYALDASAVGDPFAIDTAWRPPEGVVLSTLQEMALMLPGTHDFEAFRRRGETRRDLSRTLSEARWVVEGTQRCFYITGDGFCYRLVRSLVGAMVCVARGGASLATWEKILAGYPDVLASEQAPARGLTLMDMELERAVPWVRHG